MEVARIGALLPPRARSIARRQVVRYRHRGLLPEDALLVSYPKSGSTWLRFLLGHALAGAEQDFDSVRQTIPPVGRQRVAPALLPSGGRLVRSHEPLHPYYGRRGQPVVYLVRDGRDVALSYFHHERRSGRANDLIGFLERFVSGRVDGYGTWHDHVLAATSFAGSSAGPFLTVRYEALRANPVAELTRALDFLGVACPASLLDEVVARNDKERMRAKEARSAFLSSQASDGSPFVRSDRRETWAELVAPDVDAMFQSACGAALAAAGYAAVPGPPMAPAEDQ